MIFGGAIAAAEIDRLTAEAEINRWAEAKNAFLTKAITNSVWPRYADFMDRSQNLSAEALRTAPPTERMGQEVRGLVAGLGVLKVKLYDIRGRTVFSTQSSQIGADYSDSPGFVRSAGGDIASELEHRAEFQAIAGPLADRWVLSSYVPVRARTDGAPIVGVAEIYRDVTAQRAEARRTLYLRAAIIGAVLLLIFAILVMIVWKSDRQLAEHHRRELALRASAAEAEAKSEAKSRFLAKMSHEIRTPMNGVLGMASLLARTQLNGRQQEILGIVRQSGAALLSLLDGILDFSKIEAGKLALDSARFKVGDCVAAVADLYAPTAADKGLDFQARIDVDRDQLVSGDPQRLRQVLANLVANAIKFTERGRVILAAETVARSDDRVQVRFEVTDTGIGIAEDQRDRIFEPFLQADDSISRRFGGTGLGLSVADELVRLMGGTIACDAVAGGGTRFSFEIGLDDPVSAPLTADAPPPDADGRAETAQILVVEDNEINLMVARESLLALGYTVDTVADGASAVAAWERGTYGLILMDVQMPEVDGREATCRIRAREHERALAPIPIVALTAHAFDDDRVKCRTAGMDDYLTKPFTEEELRTTLARFVAPALPPPAGGLAEPEGLCA